MTSTRSYRAARPVEEAIAELRRCAGTHFDPAVVEAFIAAIELHGWAQPDPVALPPDSEAVETAQQDHDDPSTPIRVSGN